MRVTATMAPDFSSVVVARSRRASAQLRQKINRKMYRGAMASILSELVRSGRLKVVESFADVDAPSAAAAMPRSKRSGWRQNADQSPRAAAETYFLPGRADLPYVGVVDVAGIKIRWTWCTPTTS